MSIGGKFLNLMLLAALLVGCSSAPLDTPQRDSATSEPGPIQEASADAPVASLECTQCLTRECKGTYDRCLPKDPNGCANLNLCIRRCSAVSCMYDCGGNWAVSPEAVEYYSCVVSGCDACFPPEEAPVVKACQACLQSCHGLPDCCAGDGCLCQQECE